MKSKQIEATNRRFRRYRQLFSEYCFGSLWVGFTAQPVTPQSSLNRYTLRLNGHGECIVPPDFRFAGAADMRPVAGRVVKPQYKAKGAGA